VTLCVRRLPEYGTPVPKKLRCDTYHKLCFMICIVFIEYTKMHVMSSIKITTMILMYTTEETN
jgi:hypothetical protein